MFLAQSRQPDCEAGVLKTFWLLEVAQTVITSVRATMDMLVSFDFESPCICIAKSVRAAWPILMWGIMMTMSTHAAASFE